MSVPRGTGVPSAAHFLSSCSLQQRNCCHPTRHFHNVGDGTHQQFLGTGTSSRGSGGDHDSLSESRHLRGINDDCPGNSKGGPDDSVMFVREPLQSTDSCQTPWSVVLHDPCGSTSSARPHRITFQHRARAPCRGPFRRYETTHSSPRARLVVGDKNDGTTPRSLDSFQKCHLFAIRTLPPMIFRACLPCIREYLANRVSQLGHS